jgi:hypothetical protein
MVVGRLLYTVMIDRSGLAPLPAGTEEMQHALFAICVRLVETLGLRAAAVLIAGDRILASKGLKSPERDGDHQQVFAVGRRAALLLIVPAVTPPPTSRVPAIRTARAELAAELDDYAALGPHQAAFVPALDKKQRWTYGLSG